MQLTFLNEHIVTDDTVFMKLSAVRKKILLCISVEILEGKLELIKCVN